MKLQKLFAVLAITWLLAASAVRAQEQPPTNGNNPPADSTQPVAPLPPQNNNPDDRQTPAATARGLFVSVNPQDDGGQVQPDTHPLSGAVTPGLGRTLHTHRMFDPVFRFAEAADTSVVPGRTESVTSLGGGLAFDQDWSRYHLTADYNGAQIIDEPDTSFSRTYHHLALEQQIQWSRWGLILRNDLDVSPEASFSGLYTGVPVAASPNSTLTDITPALQTSESILTGRATRINNISLAEIDYSLTRRATMTFVGSYGFLHFTDAGYVDNSSINASAGYNYALSAKNSLALLYNYTTVHFGVGFGQETHLFEGLFGRKVTQRLSFQLAAGPELLISRNLGSLNSQRWTWSLTGSLNYQLSRKTGLDVTYFHGITAGSGVFLGATSDTVGSSANHRFTQFWSATITASYRRNGSVAPTLGASSRYDNWLAGGSLSRQLGREILIIGSYGYQRQYSAAGTCPVLSCGPVTTGRTFANVSLEWHPFTIQNE